MQDATSAKRTLTTVRHIVTLLKSHIAGDRDRFLATAMQLAAHEARQGCGKLAEELKAPVDRAQGELGGLVSASYPAFQGHESKIDE